MTVTAGRSTVGPTRESVTMSVGEFLPRRIREAGVSHAFGVPGDFNLELLQQLEDTGTLEWVGACNELNASYAAEGYARLLAGKPVPGPESSAGPAHVSALTYCTTMTTCPSGLSVTVYQMVRPSDGRWRR
jgi:glyoxylate carboligase